MVRGERIVRWRLLEDPSLFTFFTLHFQHCKVTDYFPILQISALDFSRFSAQTLRIEYFLPLLSQEGCPDGRGGLNERRETIPLFRGRVRAQFKSSDYSERRNSPCSDHPLTPPNLGGEEITLQAFSFDALHASRRLRTSLRCLAHLAAMPTLLRADALHYIARGIPTNRAKYSAEHCQASERNTGQTSRAPPHKPSSHRPASHRPIKVVAEVLWGL